MGEFKLTIQQWLFCGLVAVMFQIIFGFVYLVCFVIRHDPIMGMASMILMMGAVWQTLYIKSKIPTKEDKK